MVFIKRYPNGSLELILAAEGQVVDGVTVTADIIKDVLARFHNGQKSVLCELGRPARIFDPIENFKRISQVHLENVCGEIIEMYAYRAGHDKRLVLTGVWRACGPWKDRAVELHNDWNCGLMPRFLRIRGGTTKISTWDLKPNNLITVVALTGLNYLLEDLYPVVNSRYRETAPMD